MAEEKKRVKHIFKNSNSTSININNNIWIYIFLCKRKIK